jgi:hypothetical protein
MPCPLASSPAKSALRGFPHRAACWRGGRIPAIETEIVARSSLPNPYVGSKSSALRPYAVRATLRQLSEFQEVDTFNRPLRLAHGPDANGADRNAEPCVARRAAIGAAEAFWLALIAALVAWVVSPSANPSGDPTASSRGCVSVGKGGMICDDSTTAARKVATENADPCLSLGRGGRYCPSTR